MLKRKLIQPTDMTLRECEISKVLSFWLQNNVEILQACSNNDNSILPIIMV